MADTRGQTLTERCALMNRRRKEWIRSSILRRKSQLRERREHRRGSSRKCRKWPTTKRLFSCLRMTSSSKTKRNEKIAIHIEQEDNKCMKLMQNETKRKFISFYLKQNPKCQSLYWACCVLQKFYLNSFFRCINNIAKK